MYTTNSFSSLEIGCFISKIREKAGIKQSDLAKKITWSPAMLSRIEAGERPLSEDELKIITESIDTPEALHLSTVLQRKWQILSPPPLNHSDQNILWDAEQSLQSLTKLSKQPDIRPAFNHRIESYVEELKKHVGLLLKREHQVAFIGEIGVGKSTAICQISRLILPKNNGGFDSVLEAGGGGITVCEVHLRTGAEHEIRIDPCNDEEIRDHVRDFANHLKGEFKNDSQGLSKEIERAIRNMSGLKVRREKNTDGKTVRTDEAKELAQNSPEVRDLVIEIMKRLELHKRDCRHLLYENSVGKKPLEWLKNTFESINNGRNPNFSLPKRIEVIVPFPLIEQKECSIRIIDTKGVDNTATRADLEKHLRDTHTLAILCSRFNNAPAPEMRTLLERAKNEGTQSLETNTAFIILPHQGEALAMKDESGMQAESVEDGYELKKEQAEIALAPLKLNNLPMVFFDAFEDDEKILQDFLSTRLTVIRDTFRDQLKNTILDIEKLIVNQKKEQIQAVLQNTGKEILNWLEQHKDIQSTTIHIHNDLVDAINRAYPNTVHASITRKGSWDNLDYNHHLKYGIRSFSASLLSKNLEFFTDHCKTLKGNPDYMEAHDLIRQVEAVLRTAFEELKTKVELKGLACLSDEFKLYANRLWLDCEDEWGQGTGYRSRVVTHNTAWFSETRREKVEQNVHDLIKKEWDLALSKVKVLL